ncbi:MAG: hypothetical protein JW888_08460 [Pirellulales bacterium]|nr:hypothetical protein [Pirellulales bacterium]
MPVIRCTTKLLAAIDDLPVATPADASSPIGDWYGHLFTVERRKAILFISERTLFVCLALGVTKSDYRRIVPFFLDLLTRTLGQEGFNEEKTDWLLSLHKNMAIGRTHNRSTLGSLNNRIGDAKYLIEYDGGLDHCDVPALVHRLNETPMGPIKYSNGLVQMKRMAAIGMGTRD